MILIVAIEVVMFRNHFESVAILLNRIQAFVSYCSLCVFSIFLFSLTFSSKKIVFDFFERNQLFFLYTVKIGSPIVLSGGE